MKKFVAAALTLGMAFSVAFSAGAVTAVGLDSYNTAKSDYDLLYNNTYVKAYTEYNNSIDALIKKIQTADITTAEQIEEVTAFVNSLKNKRFDFFGNRTTPGKSRFDVPELRTAMYDAAKAKDYATAYAKCQELTQKINQRISFLEGIKNSITAFQIPAAYNYSLSYAGYNGEGTVSVKSETKGYNFSLKQQLNVTNGRLAAGQVITIQCYSGANLVKEFSETVPALSARCAKAGEYDLTFVASSNSANSDNYVYHVSGNGATKMVILANGTAINTINVSSGVTYWIDLPKSQYDKKTTVTVNFYNGSSLVKTVTAK